MKYAQPIVALVALALIVSSACVASRSATAAPPQLQGCSILPADNVWNTPIDKLPVDSQSNAYVANIGPSTGMHPDFGSGLYDGGPIGIPFNVVPNGQPKVDVTFDYADESDAGPYPIQSNPQIEFGSDHHILVVEQGTCKLYETWDSSSNGDGTWHAGSGAIFVLGSNALRTDGWTSADAAGLPILPGLVRHDEVAAGAINHALRFTVRCTAHAYVWPARHQAVPEYCPATLPGGTLPPPMGQRFRLKAGFNTSGFSHDTQVILTALKKYGMFVADNGSSWYLSGEPNPGWDNDALVSELRQVHGTDFEAVDESALKVNDDSGQVTLGAIAQDSKSVAPGGADQGQQVIYTIQIVGDGSAITLSDPLPADVTMVDNSLKTTGAALAAYNGTTRTVSWSGTPSVLDVVTITYAVVVSTAAIQPIANTANVNHGGTPKPITAVLIANPIRGFLPLVRN